MRDWFKGLAQFDVVEQSAGRIDPQLAQIIFGLCCTGLAVGGRFAIDTFAPAAGPFALIYPAVLIATLFGRWRAGVVTAISSFVGVWVFLLPHAGLFQLARPADGPRTMVNILSVAIVLLLAEIFRIAVRDARRERDTAITSLRDLNEDLARQVEEQTRELRQTWTVSPDLLGILNANGYFEASNPAWQTVLGWPEDHIRTTKFFEFIHPDDLERTYGAWEQINQGQPILRFENRYRRKSGGWTWLSWVVVPEGGRFYGSARDITIEKDRAEALANMEDALRQAQKMEAIGQLTGGVAHDFNNLLTVILGSVEMMRRPNLTAERRDRYLDAIGNTAQRAAKLTGQLLAFARRQSLTPEHLDTGANLIEIRGIIKTLVGSRVEIDLQLPDATCVVLADRTQFDTAIINMAVNARDAMDGEGRITIAVRAAAAIPEVRSHPMVTGDYVAVSVADSGTGIAEEDLVRIFEPFFTTKPAGTGTGLGLAQVIGFAKQSDGEIRVESAVGSGTTFTLYLPRSKDGAVGRSLNEGTEHDPSGEGICVLVVEDNEHVGEFATSALAELGYDSILVTNANECLAKLADDCTRYHIVFTDVVMAGMNGVELAQEIRRLYPDVPVILTSGYSHVLAQNGDYGFELLRKPYSIEQLSQVLKKTLTWSRRDRQTA